MTRELRTLARVDGIERRLAALEQYARAAREPSVGRTADIYIGKTWSESEGTYPTGAANTFGVVLQEGTFDEVPGTQAPVYQEMSAGVQITAYALGGNFIQRGTYVFVLRAHGYWWILDEVA